MSALDLATFRSSLQQPEPPPGVPPLVTALWWDAQGDWNRAHSIAQTIEGADAAWVHAYLHRREGDTANAGYWYRRAGQPGASSAFEAEREAIVQALLDRGN